MKIKGVTIGDQFKIGKNSTGTVVDFYEVRSVTTGEIISHMCIVQGNGPATNKFDVPFTTVLRNKI